MLDQTQVGVRSELTHARGGAVLIECVRRHYGAVKALDGISLDVCPGEFLALLGPSGSGKTTLLMAVAGFETPDGGRIRVDGIDITEVPPNRRNLGMVFQKYALFPHMTLRQNVAFPLKMRGVNSAERAKKAERMLGIVGLEGFGDRVPAQLSGGQQQRVALARAIIYEPPVLLMDEPLSALDKNLRERMRLEIKDLQRRLGITVIFVTHDQEEALVMADRIAVLDRGKLVQIGEPRALYDRPANPFVAGFLGEVIRIRGTIDSDGISLNLADGRRIPICQSALTGEALVAVRPEAVEISSTRLGESALQGRLRDVIFAGASTIFRVDAGLDDAICIRKPSSFELSPMIPGQAVWLSWRTEDGRVFPATAS